MILSFVVPVYNVESYLKKCVDSLLIQGLSLEDYEIILVDDGSTDSSGVLCDGFAATHKNIQVVHQENKGLSAARNVGITMAKGKYIQFVDSDDYLIPHVLPGLISQMEEMQLEVLRFNYQNVSITGKVFEPNKYPKPFVNYSEEICDGSTFLNERLGFACYACQFIILTSLLQKNGIFFKEGIYYEDVEWTPRLLTKVVRIASTEVVAYNYLFRTHSIARTVDLRKKEKAIRDRFATISLLLNMKDQISDNRWFKGMVAQISISIINDVSIYFYENRRYYFSKLKHLNVYPLSTFHATQSAKKKIYIANVSPRLLCYILHLNRK